MKHFGAILTAQNTPLTLDHYTSDSLKLGQVLVSMKYAGICGSQLGEVRGVKGQDPYLPHLMGHEGIGKVVEIGSGVSSVSVGDPVILHWKHGDGLNVSIDNLIWNDRHLNSGCVTAFSDVVVVSENRVTKIATSTALPEELLPILGCAIPTAWGALENIARMKIGERVLITGAGGVGIASAVGARAMGCSHVFLMDKDISKLSNLGFKDWIDLVDASDFDRFERSWDVAIDTTGDPRVIEKLYDLGGVGKRVVLLGVMSQAERVTLHTLKLHFDFIFQGSHGGDGYISRDLARYVRALESHNECLDLLEYQVRPLSLINNAFSDLEAGRVNGRIIVDCRA